MQQKRLLLSGVLGLGVFISTGCKQPICPPYVPPSMEFAVFDSGSGGEISCGSTIVVSKDGEALYDSAPLITGLGCRYSSASIGVGSFDVIVSKPGYLEWQGTVDVPQGTCGAETQSVSAELDSDGSKGSPSVAHSTIGVYESVDQFPLNETFHVIVQLNDENQNPVPGEALDVQLSGTGSATVYYSNQSTSNGFGQYSMQLRGSVAETLELGFSIGGEQSSSTFTVTLGQ